MSQEGDQNIRHINETTQFPKGEFQHFENKVAALLAAKKPHLKNGLGDIHRDAVFTHIVHQYRNFDTEKQEAILKELEGKTFEELNDIYFNPESKKSAAA